MPKIDFYILSDPDEKSRLVFACRLIEKAYKRGHRIYIHADSLLEANQLDELLWTYRDDSFLPHHLHGEGPDPAPPIQIGHVAQSEKHRDILINLNKNIPVFYPQFARVIELVMNNPSTQECAREHYRLYRADGHLITTHKLQ